MENNNSNLFNVEELPKCKLYSIKEIGWASFFGGPLAGCFLMSFNYKKLGNSKASKISLFIGIIVSIIIFGSGFFISKNIASKLPHIIIPIIYYIILYVTAKNLQGEDLERHTANGGLICSGWNVVGVIVISLIITFAFVFGLACILAEANTVH